MKIFPRNVSDLPSLARDVGEMQRLAARGRFGIPLFVATDQEGGWVRQIKDETSVSPGNLALGASGVPADAYRTGYYLGSELAALGINMDFAPTADVYSNPEASVIGPRSFGSDPSFTGLLSAAFARGMRTRASSARPSISRGTARRTRIRTGTCRRSTSPWTSSSTAT